LRARLWNDGVEGVVDDMTKVKDIYEFMKAIAPEEMALDTDNVGFLVGTGEAEVSRILVSLDITSDVISEALEIGAQLIVAHHPLFFSLKSVTDSDITGSKIIRLISGGISAVCMHTNLDAAEGGVNDALAVAVGIADDSKRAEPLADNKRLDTGEIVSLGRVGYLSEPCCMSDYLERLKKALSVNGLRYHDVGRDVYKVAISSGGGSSEWENALKSDCDTFITADIKYHLFLEAKERGINLIDAGHYSTENLVSDVLQSKLKAAFPATYVTVSKAQSQTIEFF
jgi:dinuclear metal center YbgI/SA1388 family protein